jgi:hypothetical protein
MITIQELHAYYRFSQMGIVPTIPCPINELDGDMMPWVDENELPCLWCLSCNTKSYLGRNQIDLIRKLLHP